MSERTAYDLLAVHEKFGGEGLRLAQTLSRSVLYLLARPATPDEARQEAIARAEAGGLASAADGPPRR
jgi:hypothetical protein